MQSYEINQGRRKKAIKQVVKTNRRHYQKCRSNEKTTRKKWSIYIWKRVRGRKK